MATTTRQSNLFLAEDWTKVYETFREADFQAYDFETIRKSMIDYLQSYYPEDFNDFIESSEYIALIDLIAFLGQSLSFRTDLNARENFLETAERRDSILRLAKMLNYHPKRTQVSRGVLKITSVSTTEDVVDTNGTSLRDVEIFWGDATNTDFLEQFTTIMNSAMVNTQQYGNPSLRATVAGVNIEEYQLSLVPNTVPVYDFSATVGGRDTDFELVNGTYSGKSYLYEIPPKPGSTFNTIYKNDGRGFNSINSGFFFYFKQGLLQTVDFSLTEGLPNRVVDIDVGQIDNNDVWLYKVGSLGEESLRWEKVPAVSGTNVIYNSLSKNLKTLFSVNSRADDQISLVFGDGVFSTIPVGNFRSYFRTSNGFTYKIAPEELQDVQISIPYLSHSGQLETLTVVLSLQQTVGNAVARENLNDVKVKAQQQYYTQNRMVTGEDYQILPFTNFNNVVKSKAINRTASGISRYLDVRDTTGKYSSTNIVAEDGIFYRSEDVLSYTFNFTTSSDIANMISLNLEPIIQNKESFHYYLKNYSHVDASALNVTWEKTTQTTGTVTGYFKNALAAPEKVGAFNSNNMKYIKIGALIKFTAPSGKVFDINNNLVTGVSGTLNTKDYIWTSASSIVDDGTNQGNGNLDDGTGPITLTEIIPDGAVLAKVIANWNNVLSTQNRTDIISAVGEYKTFGLRYDYDTQSWAIITALNLNTATTFSTENAGSTAGTGLDNSWLFYFTNDGTTYTVQYRSTSYVFESYLETRFYFDKDLKIFDPRSGKTIKDKINILKVNSQPDTATNLGVDYQMNVDSSIIESDGFVLSEKIKVTFPDQDDDGIVDDPDVFDLVVSPDSNADIKVVFYKSYLDVEGFTRYQAVARSGIETAYKTLAEINLVLANYGNGQVFYASTPKKFYELTVDASSNRTSAEATDYITRVGRDNLLFQYTHNAPNNRRIDPSPSNIIDLFLLTSQYDTDYRNWISSVSGNVTKPAKPTTTELRDNFGSLEDLKSVSDALIFNSVTYRPLFGSKADAELQAVFKVVKNTSTLVSDSEIKERVITAINDYFALENWDFGDTFYFSELSAYLHSTLSPDVLSIVIVPKSASSTFGSLFQIRSQADEIFISAATVNDVELIDVLTAAQLRATGSVTNAATETTATESVSGSSSTATSTAVTTTANTTSTSTTTSGGGYSY